MAIYHISSNGPGECRAEKGKCPFAPLTDHFTSIEAAAKSFEESMGGAAPAALKKTAAPKLKGFDVLSQGSAPRNAWGSWKTYPYDKLMQTDGSTIDEYLKDVESNAPEVVITGDAARNHQLAVTAERILQNRVDSYGKRRAADPVVLAAKKSIEELGEYKDSQKKLMKASDTFGLSYGRYLLAKTAQKVLQPRVVLGEKLAPGEGLVRGLYSKDGKFIGVVKFNMRGPDAGFSAEAPDGTRTSFTIPRGTPEERYAKMKEDGYVLGPVVAPVSLSADFRATYASGSIAGAKALEKNPPRPVSNFDRGAYGWANICESQAAKIEDTELDKYLA